MQTTTKNLHENFGCIKPMLVSYVLQINAISQMSEVGTIPVNSTKQCT